MTVIIKILLGLGKISSSKTLINPLVTRQSRYKKKWLVFSETDEFRKVTDKNIALLERLADEVEKQKIKAIGARNILHHLEKTKENKQQQLQVSLTEFFLPQ